MTPDYQGLLLERLTVAYLISFQDQDDIDWKNKKHTHTRTYQVIIKTMYCA